MLRYEASPKIVFDSPMYSGRRSSGGMFSVSAVKLIDPALLEAESSTNTSRNQAKARSPAGPIQPAATIRAKVATPRPAASTASRWSPMRALSQPLIATVTRPVIVSAMRKIAAAFSGRAKRARP